MDDADRAQVEIERQAEATIAAARAAVDKALADNPRSHCDTCGHELAWHRKPRGRCVECQEIRERRMRQMALGA